MTINKITCIIVGTSLEGNQALPRVPPNDEREFIPQTSYPKRVPQATKMEINIVNGKSND